MLVLKSIIMNPLTLWFFYPKGCYWRSPCRSQKTLKHLKIEVFKVKPKRKKYIVVPIVCGLSNQNLSQMVHICFGHVSISRLWIMKKKLPIMGLPMTGSRPRYSPCPNSVVLSKNNSYFVGINPQLNKELFEVCVVFKNVTWSRKRLTTVWEYYDSHQA